MGQFIKFSEFFPESVAFLLLLEFSCPGFRRFRFDQRDANRDRDGRDQEVGMEQGMNLKRKIDGAVEAASAEPNRKGKLDGWGVACLEQEHGESDQPQSKTQRDHGAGNAKGEEGLQGI